jgi:hypothetical protein
MSSELYFNLVAVGVLKDNDLPIELLLLQLGSTVYNLNQIEIKIE